MKKIALYYIGYEQGVWGDIAFRRESHFYIMPGILYLRAMLLQDEWIVQNSDVACRYFNRSVQSRDELLQTIIADNPAVCGFATFCWNRDDVYWLAQRIKERLPSCMIILGGPEIGAREEMSGMEFLNTHSEIHALIYGEAELIIVPLCQALLSADSSLINAINGVTVRLSDTSIHHNAAINHTPDLNTIPSIYPLDLTIPRSAQCGLCMVYESVRGCPFTCIYCQFGRQNHRMRTFDMARVERELTWLLDQQIDCLHLADAVFDLEPERAKNLLRFLIDHNHCTSLFFYCSFTKLDTQLAKLFAAAQCQIGVGVQSTNPAVLTAIERTVNASLFLDKKEILQQIPLNFYIDLIFGLPADSMPSFKQSVNDALTLNPSFMMLFPLTVVSGTELARRQHDYDVIALPANALKNLRLDCDINYTNIALHHTFSPADLEQFDDAALACFYYYNRFNLSLNYLQKRCGSDLFSLYQQIGQLTKVQLQTLKQKPTNTTWIAGFDEIIKTIFLSILSKQGAQQTEVEAFSEIFKLDIFRIFILTAPQRRKRFDQNQACLQKESGAINGQDQLFIMSTHGKLINTRFSLNDLSNLAAICHTILPHPDMVYIHAPFEQWHASVISLSLYESFILDLLLPDHATSLSAVQKQCSRKFKNSDLSPINTALKRLENLHIIRTIS